MLLSERQERERRFKLALRAGIPITILITLVLYSTFFKNSIVEFNIENTILGTSILFVSVYFIYFLIELSVKETLIDQTTQGFNEKAFISQFEDYKPKTLVMLTLENLSIINENYCSDDVDLLLYNITHKLDSKLKNNGFKKSLIARRYGAEFLIAIDTNSSEIKEVFQNFINENKTLNNIELNLNFAVLTNTDDELEKDISHLKDTIASQQTDSPNKTIPDIVKDAKELSKVEYCIIDSIKKKNLTLSFRPLLNTKTDKINIYEISVQLESLNIGNILPRVYLPIVNRLGLGREYDLSIVNHVINLLPLIDKDISLSFNLSPFSLRDEKFQKEFFAYLDNSNIDPSRLIIELYERKTHHDLSGYLKTLNKFRIRGIRIAIDNFGSSSSSMEYMKNFHFDLVQFDRDYVTKLDDSNTYAILNSMIKMSKDLNIITIAKWVDNDSQKNRLKELGIDYLQGFGIEKPIDEKLLIDRYN